jgi:hypothetical protein
VYWFLKEKIPDPGFLYYRNFHPGEDLLDGITYEMLLDITDQHREAALNIRTGIPGRR